MSRNKHVSKIASTSRCTPKVTEYIKQVAVDRELERFMIFSPTDSNNASIGARHQPMVQSSTASSSSNSRISDKCVKEPATSVNQMKKKNMAAAGAKFQKPEKRHSLKSKKEDKIHIIPIMFTDESPLKNHKPVGVPCTSASAEELRTPTKEATQAQKQDRRMQTPDSALKSHNRFEWDSAADLGYNRAVSTNNISTLERSLLSDHYFCHSFTLAGKHRPRNENNRTNQSDSNLNLLRAEPDNESLPPLASSTIISNSKTQNAKIKVMPTKCSQGTNTTLHKFHNQSAQTSARCSNRKVEGGSSWTASMYSTSAASSFDYQSSLDPPVSNASSVNSTENSGNIATKKQKNAQQLQKQYAAQLEEIFSRRANKESQTTAASTPAASRSSRSCYSLTAQSDLDLGIELLCSLVKSRSLGTAEKKQLVREIAKRISCLDALSASSCSLSASQNSRKSSRRSSLLNKFANCMSLQQSRPDEQIEQREQAGESFIIQTESESQLDAAPSTSLNREQLHQQQQHTSVGMGGTYTKTEAKSSNSPHITPVTSATTNTVSTMSMTSNTSSSNEPVTQKTNDNAKKFKVTEANQRSSDEKYQRDSESDEQSTSNTDAEMAAMQEWLNPMTQSEIEYEERQLHRTQEQQQSSTSSEDIGLFRERINWIDAVIMRWQNLRKEINFAKKQEEPKQKIPQVKHQPQAKVQPQTKQQPPANHQPQLKQPPQAKQQQRGEHQYQTERVLSNIPSESEDTKKNDFNSVKVSTVQPQMQVFIQQMGALLAEHFNWQEPMPPWEGPQLQERQQHQLIEKCAHPPMPLQPNTPMELEVQLSPPPLPPPLPPPRPLVKLPPLKPREAAPTLPPPPPPPLPPHTYSSSVPKPPPETLAPAAPLALAPVASASAQSEQQKQRSKMATPVLSSNSSNRSESVCSFVQQRQREFQEHYQHKKQTQLDALLQQCQQRLEQQQLLQSQLSQLKELQQQQQHERRAQLTEQQAPITAVCQQAARTAAPTPYEQRSQPSQHVHTQQCFMPCAHQPICFCQKNHHLLQPQPPTVYDECNYQLPPRAATTIGYSVPHMPENAGYACIEDAIYYQVLESEPAKTASGFVKSHYVTSKATATSTTSSASSMICISSEISIPISEISTTTTTTHQYDDVAACATQQRVNGERQYCQYHHRHHRHHRRRHQHTQCETHSSNQSVVATAPAGWNSHLFAEQNREQHSQQLQLHSGVVQPINDVQMGPRGIAYVLQFEKDGKKSDVQTQSLTLQDYLQLARPEFCAKSKARKAILNQMQLLRTARRQEMEQLIENTSLEALDTRLKELPPPAASLVRVFSTKEMKALTNKRCESLPEVLAAQRKECEERRRRSNRIMRDVFNRRLQLRVRNGKLSLNHSKTVI